MPSPMFTVWFIYFQGIMEALSQSGSYGSVVSQTIQNSELVSNEMSVSVLYMHELRKRNQLPNIGKLRNIHIKEYYEGSYFGWGTTELPKNCEEVDRFPSTNICVVLYDCP